MKKALKVSLGTDPEFFLKETGSGRYVSAIPYVAGTKHEPVPLPSGGTIQRDNVALEFATDPDFDLVQNVRKAFADIFSSLPQGLEVVADPSASFDLPELDHPEAMEFGCEPDFDAWHMTMNEKPFCADEAFRSAGAHIHVGGLDAGGKQIKGLEFLLEIKGKVRMIRCMDTVHGIISTTLDRSEAAIRRRELYGKAGAHRPTSYGVEYRVLSNFWMKTPTLVTLFGKSLTEDAVRLILENKDEKLIEQVGAEEIQNIINEGNIELAERVVNNFLAPHLSAESKELLSMAKEELDDYNDLRTAWSI